MPRNNMVEPQLIIDNFKKLDKTKTVAHQPPKAILFLNIHLNPQNHQSWKSITNDAKISLTIDLFHIGLVFLNLKMEKQHFVLKS